MTAHNNSGAVVAITLRTIAAWLESHPEAVCHEINFIERPIRVHHFGLHSVAEAEAHQAQIGGTWTPFDVRWTGDGSYRSGLEIAPNVFYTVFMSGKPAESAA